MKTDDLFLLFVFLSVFMLMLTIGAIAVDLVMAHQDKKRARAISQRGWDRGWL